MMLRPRASKASADLDVGVHHDSTLAFLRIAKRPCSWACVLTPACKKLLGAGAAFQPSAKATAAQDDEKLAQLYKGPLRPIALPGSSPNCGPEATRRNRTWCSAPRLRTGTRGLWMCQRADDHLPVEALDSWALPALSFLPALASATSEARPGTLASPAFVPPASARFCEGSVYSGSL